MRKWFPLLLTTVCVAVVLCLPVAAQDKVEHIGPKAPNVDGIPLKLPVEAIRWLDKMEHLPETCEKAFWAGGFVCGSAATFMVMLIIYFVAIVPKLAQPMTPAKPAA